MAANNRYMDPFSLIKKGMGIKSSAEKGLQNFGKSLKDGYLKRKKEWESSPAYKKAQQRARYEGGM